MKNKLGLSLSGGGYRAAAFHLGALRKLHDLKILEKVNVISTISGGSIVGAFYKLHSDDFFEFEMSIKEKLKISIIKKLLFSTRFLVLYFITIIILILAGYLLLFSKMAWLSYLILIIFIWLFIKYQFKILPISKTIEKFYDELFYGGESLSSFSTHDPRLVINATNLQTNRQFTFSSTHMGDSSYSKNDVQFLHGEFPIARAVMASSCVPFAFTPVPISKDFIKVINPERHIEPILVDGGVYDNQGIHRLIHGSSGQYVNPFECDTVIVSDAGNIFPFQGLYNNLITLLLRTSELFMDRIKKFQMMEGLYYNKHLGKREIAYISLGWDFDNCINSFVENCQNGTVLNSILGIHKINVTDSREMILDKIKSIDWFKNLERNKLSPEEIRIARSVKTNLTALSDRQINCLSKFAGLLTELQIRLYCPSLFIS